MTACREIVRNTKGMQSQMFGVPVEKHGVNGHLRQKGKMLNWHLDMADQLVNQFGGESVTYEGVGGTKKWERFENYGNADGERG